MPDAADLLVIGAGPAGLAAAIHAAERGLHVLVLERMPQPGMKLLATGGGHCNLTNTSSADEMMAAFGRQGRFMRDALAVMDGPGLRQFVGRLGVATQVEDDGFHVFPASRSARDVQLALLARARDLGVTINCGARVRKITMDAGHVTGVVTDHGQLACRHLLLATGGAGYPGLGGGNDGYELASAMGHQVVTPVPALTSLRVADSWVGKLAGMTLPEGTVRIAVKRPPPPQHGPLLFTHQGLSGPPALNLSGTVARLLTTAPTVPLHIALTAETKPAAWERRCDCWATANGRRRLRNLLREFIPAALADILCELIPGIADRPVAEVARDARQRLAATLTALPLTAIGTGGFAEAMATAGGVSLKEVDPRTMGSRLIHGLSCAGEILDLDGPCGGYNLQWAFASGTLAGMTAATMPHPQRGSGVMAAGSVL